MIFNIISSISMKTTVSELILTALILALRPCAGVEYYYPQKINPALGKPVTLSPEDATCGELETENICESRTNTVNDCATRPTNCNLDCPYEDALPASVEVFENIPYWDTNCVVRDYSSPNFAPSQSLQSDYAVEFKQGPASDRCYVTLSSEKVIPFILMRSWSISVSLWIKPNMEEGTTG